MRFFIGVNIWLFVYVFFSNLDNYSSSYAMVKSSVPYILLIFKCFSLCFEKRFEFDEALRYDF